MLDKLDLGHFTVFREARFEFGRGLNILVGDNGTGKTHVLKLGYLFCRAWSGLTQHGLRLGKQRAEAYLEERLAGLFKTSDLANLISKGYKNAAAIDAHVVGRVPTLQIRTQSDPEFTSTGVEESMPWSLRLKRDKDQRVRVEATLTPQNAASNAFVPRSIFVPSKEIVSLFKGLIGLFESYREFPLDETYRDLAASLSTLEPATLSSLMSDIGERMADAMGGELHLVNGELLFKRRDGSELEPPLMAEGHRKLALLIYLVRHGLIERGSALFWDEPEANLNPAALRLLAQALHALAGSGVQVILATHSLFLLREFEVLAGPSANEEGSAGAQLRFFGLGLSKKGVTVSVGDDVASVDPLVLLDEDLRQSERYMGTLE